MKLPNSSKCFLAGCFANAAVFSLYTDYLGQDGIIESINNHWISPAISVPIAIIVLIAALVVDVRVKVEERGFSAFIESFRRASKDKDK